LEDLREEFGAYALRIVWIYRDPVNVFYSMHREGWVPFNEIGSDLYIEQWKKRSYLAHEFYQRHSDLIAIVRYEDFFVDSDVFRGLCDWLNIESKSFFQVREVVCGGKNEHCSCALAPPTDMPRLCSAMEQRFKCIGSNHY